MAYFRNNTVNLLNLHSGLHQQASVPIGTCILLSLLGALASLYLLRTYFSALKPAI